jgi:ABC-2 type transport system permease protein
LILLFGYGMSLDVTNLPVAIVLEDPSPASTDLAASFELSRYFDVQKTTSMRLAEDWMLARKVDGIVRIRPDFSRRLSRGDAEVQLLVHGIDANRARIIQGYAQAAVGVWAARRSAEGERVSTGPVQVQNRLWFNETNESRYFLVPGLIVLVMTLIGALLTSLVVAREWERGTMEQLAATPVHRVEVILGKLLPYLGIGLLDITAAILIGLVLFQVPFRGNVLLLYAMAFLFLLGAMGLGIAISAAFKSQLLATQTAMIATYLPSLILSGLIFDIASMPWLLQVISNIVPAKYFIVVLRGIFLKGVGLDVLWVQGAAMVLFAAAGLTLAVRSFHKELA